jgi:rhodanese-related sulfurtransferase
MNPTSEQLINSPVFSRLVPGEIEHLVTEHVGMLDVLDDIYREMEPVEVGKGEEVVRYREPGDRYYVIRAGEAEVWKPHPETDEWQRVALLGPGEMFGEEAILVDGCRTATVRMTTAGQLLAVSREVFNSRVRNRMVEEVSAVQAMMLSGNPDAIWLDCRFEVEYQESHIPDSRLLPLHMIRESASELDPTRLYLVYCRSGRRSVCAAYLLRERGFRAVSVRGGMLKWPYETV